MAVMSNIEKSDKSANIPIWQRYALTIPEAAEYFNIGENKLRRLIADKGMANYILMNGNRVLLKRKLFEKFLDEINVV